MRFKLFSLCLLLLMACAPPPSTPTPSAQFCQTRTEGRWIKNANGNNVIVHGVNLPTLTEMEKSGVSVSNRLRDLAAQGATVVRLQMGENEMSQTVIPLKIMPVVHAANELGMVVILSWNMVIEEVNNPQISSTEEWIRQLNVYIAREPGVWVDPINEIRSIPLARRRNVAQRYIDIIRGYNILNIVVINEAFWLLDTNPEINKPLLGANIVYGVRKLAQPAQWPVEQQPFLITDWDGGAYDVATAKIGSIARLRLDNTLAQTQWKLAQPVCK
ncbi:MAG: cellulase family glycosylhydrolase [Chloroflexota bacterium]|jgi:hypothetical protein